MRKLVLPACIFALAVSAQIPLPTAPTKYVTDAAGVIPDEREHALNERLAEFERMTTNQLIVYVDRRIPEGTTLEEMSAEAIHTWGVGQADTDNGAILFLFIDSRDSRIEVGYGLEGMLTDAISKRILVDMRPRLRDGDYAGAIEQGADAILQTLMGSPPPQPVAAVPAEAPRAKGTFGSGLVALLIFVGFAFFLIKVIRHLSESTWSGGWSSGHRTDDDTSSSSSWSDYSSSSSSDYSSSSSSDSSSSSSSDFSGGGGSGGGGGASDKW